MVMIDQRSKANGDVKQKLSRLVVTLVLTFVVTFVQLFDRTNLAVVILRAVAELLHNTTAHLEIAVEVLDK